MNYVDAPAVRDRGLITASGLADVEFARELFEQLGVLSADERAIWAALFRSARLPGGGCLTRGCTTAARPISGNGNSALRSARVSPSCCLRGFSMADGQRPSCKIQVELAVAER